MKADVRETTRILARAADGDGQAASQLAPLVQGKLREIAARYMDRERPDHTLQPTDLVHEAYLRLVNQDQVNWQGRTHFLAVGAQMMRRVLVDHARARQAAKRGGGQARLSLSAAVVFGRERALDLLDLEEALEELGHLDARQEEIVTLRYFSGLTVKETAQRLGVSAKTVERDWTMARAWLHRRLSAPT